MRRLAIASLILAGLAVAVVPYSVAVSGAAHTSDIDTDNVETERASQSGWPTYRGDASRSGYTSDRLPEELVLHWKVATGTPQPAWPRDERMLFDRAPHVVVADGRAFCGSTVDGVVRALDVRTGDELWRFHTEGPIRCAPVVWNDRLFVGSDDGWLYELSTKDGSLSKKWRGGPSDERVLGNEHIVSRWPVRGGAVIRDGILYFAAGIWQAEGVFLKAIDLATGEVSWTNSEAATIHMPQPHGNAVADSGISVQGHLAATEDRLFVPTGRAVPASFSRADGEFEYYHLQRERASGGTEILVNRGVLYNGGAGYFTDSGDRACSLGRGTVTASPEWIIRGSAGAVTATIPKEAMTKDRRGRPTKVVRQESQWTVSGVPADKSLIVAGDKVVAGGDGRITLVDTGTRKVLWKTEVEGIPYDLAAADGRLFVGTDRGEILCFGAKSSRPAQTMNGVSDGNDELAETAADSAEAIVRRTKLKEGYCVDLGCGDGDLALALARATELRIIAVDPDPENVKLAREKLHRAGLYGTRVWVLQADLKQTHLPGMFANLVVSQRSTTAELSDAERAEALRLRQPFGGITCLGKPDELEVAKRGAPENAGSWTHQYSDAANTGVSTDAVSGPLSVLWYQDIDLELPQRHGRGPAPLFFEGRIFAEGMNGLRAVDAYNGRTLWEFEQPGVLKAYDADHLTGTAVTGSNICVAKEGVFLRNDDTCYRLDHATGEIRGRITTPGGGPWGYIACEDGILFGSIANENFVVKHTYRPSRKGALLSESETLFAVDPESGNLLWRYDAAESIRHNAIAIGDGKVFLIDRARALDDLLERPRGVAGKPLVNENRNAGRLVCLDTRTGKELWSDDTEIFGTVLSYSVPADALVMSYQSTRYKLPSEKGGRLAAYEAHTGKKLWDRKAKYHTRVLINGDTIFAQGGAWDLRTGKPNEFELAKAHGCGQLAGGKNVVLFRSATLAWSDYSAEPKINNFGGLRPGCWINAIPAGGLVLVPDASAGCTCSYQNRAWMALTGN